MTAQQDISRSQFLRTTAAAFAGLALPSISGAAPKSNPADPAHALPKKLADSKIPVNGTRHERLVALDDIMSKFMQQNSVPAATVAIALQGKVIANRAYGWSDKALTKEIQPTALLPLGTCEEPILRTAVKVLLAQQMILPKSRKPLSIDMPYFELMQREFELQPVPGKKPFPGLENITIRHLVQHCSGMPELSKYSAFGKELGIPGMPTLEDVVRYAWCYDYKRPEPGAKYDPSLLTFPNPANARLVSAEEDLLRFLVHKCSGNYIDFLQRNIFSPAGVGNEVAQSRTNPAERDAREPYYWCPASLPSLLPGQGGRMVPVTEGAGHTDIRVTPAFSATALAQYLQYFMMGSDSLLRTSAAGGYRQELKPEQLILNSEGVYRPSQAGESYHMGGAWGVFACLEQRLSSKCSVAVLMNSNPSASGVKKALREQIVKELLEPNKL